MHVPTETANFLQFSAMVFNLFLAPSCLAIQTERRRSSNVRIRGHCHNGRDLSGHRSGVKMMSRSSEIRVLWGKGPEIPSTWTWAAKHPKSFPTALNKGQSPFHIWKRKGFGQDNLWESLPRVLLLETREYH